MSKEERSPLQPLVPRFNTTIKNYTTVGMIWDITFPPSAQQNKTQIKSTKLKIKLNDWLF